MQIKKFCDWSIFSKIMGISVGTMILTSFVILFYFLPMIEDHLIQQKRDSTRNLVEVAYAVMQDYNVRAESGAITLEEAKKAAASEIQNLRYNEKDYFWINDLGPKMIMHPFMPEMNGKDLSDFKDPSGKALFVEFVRVCKESGSGFVDYLWPKPGTEQPVEKVSYVKLFKPWSWIVGSGMYIDSVKAEVNGLMLKIIIALIITIVIALIATNYISRTINGPLAKCVKLAKDIEGGDLTHRLEIEQKDATGSLAVALTSMSANLNMMVGRINQAVGNVAMSAAEVSDTASQISSGINNQVQQVEQAATAATEVSQTILDVAKNAGDASAAAKESVTAATDGKLVVDETVAGMLSIAQYVQTSASTIGKLGESSEQIGDIINVINDIAGQTNLLALNAAIEAARAGEQGRGFAVVADEVRRLAERTGHATGEISEMIKKIQKDTAVSVDSMQEGQKKAEEGVKLAEKSRESLDKIVRASDTCLDMVQSIAAATEEQSAAIEEVSRTMGEIADVTRTAQEAVSLINESASKFSSITTDLKNFVGWFKLDEKSGSGKNNSAASAVRKYPSVKVQ